jgi:hypothetical protein
MEARKTTKTYSPEVKERAQVGRPTTSRSSSHHQPHDLDSEP